MVDDYQLVQMHRTEGINVAYDFVVMETVEHQFTVRPGLFLAMRRALVFLIAAMVTGWAVRNSLTWAQI